VCEILFVGVYLGQCPACPEKCQQTCQCGRHVADRPCATPQWQCDEVRRLATEMIVLCFSCLAESGLRVIA